MEFNPDGSGQKIFAKGLRNAVGLAVNPKTDTVWVTVNGRDWLGDDLPPETIYDLGKDGGDARLALLLWRPRARFATSQSQERTAAKVSSNQKCRCRRTPLRWDWRFMRGRNFPPNTRTISS